MSVESLRPAFQAQDSCRSSWSPCSFQLCENRQKVGKLTSEAVFGSSLRIEKQASHALNQDQRFTFKVHAVVVRGATSERRLSKQADYA